MHPIYTRVSCASGEIISTAIFAIHDKANSYTDYKQAVPAIHRSALAGTAYHNKKKVANAETLKD